MNLNVGGLFGALVGGAGAAIALFGLLEPNRDANTSRIRLCIFALVVGAVLGNLLWAAIFPPKERGDSRFDDSRRRSRRRRDDEEDEYETQSRRRRKDRDDEYDDRRPRRRYDDGDDDEPPPRRRRDR